MSAAAQEPLRLVTAPRPPARRSGKRVYLAVVIVVLLATLAAVATSLSPGRRGLSGVAPEQRAQLLARTVEELRQFCGPGHAPALDEHCRELAAFAARLEECRGDCEELVRPFLTPKPTR
jgi:hypothetical protein